MPFARHFWNMIRMSGFAAEITFGPEPVIDTDRKDLARRLHRRVSEIFVPVVDHPPRSTGYPFAGENRAGVAGGSDPACG
jgi:hypothetical protein